MAAAESDHVGTSGREWPLAGQQQTSQCPRR